MKIQYISPIIELIETYNEEILLAGSGNGTSSGQGNDPDDPTNKTDDGNNPIPSVDDDDLPGGNLGKGGTFEW